MAKLTIEIGAKIEGMKRGLAQAKSKVARFAQGVKKRMMSVKGAIAGAFVVGGAIRGITKLVNKADEIGKLSARIGFTAEEFQKLTFAARRAGASNEDVERAIKRMQSTIVDAERGLASATDGFDALGISVQDLKGKRPEEQFAIIARAMNGIEDATMKSATAQDVFGRSGTALIPLLGTYEQLKKEASELGGIIDNETVKAAEQLKDSAENLNTALMATVANSGFITFLNDIAQAAAEASNALNSLDAGGFAEGETLEIAGPTAAEIEKARREGLSSGQQGGAMFGPNSAQNVTGATIQLETDAATKEEIKAAKQARDAALIPTVAEAKPVADLADADFASADPVGDFFAGQKEKFDELFDGIKGANEKAAQEKADKATKEEQAKMKELATAFQQGSVVQSRLARIGGEKSISVDKQIPQQQLQAMLKNVAVNERIAQRLEDYNGPYFPS